MAVVEKEGHATYAALKALRPHQTGLLRTITAVDGYVGTTQSRDGQPYVVLEGVGTLHARLGYTFSGAIKDGEPSGQGLLRWEDGHTVMGVFAHGTVDGTGQLEWPNGDVYTGDLRRSVRHGEGTFITDGGAARYEGGWQDGMRHGTGVQQYANGSLYSGQWAHNARQGRGTLRYQSGDVYEGEWNDDVPAGHGVMGWVDASKLYYKELYAGAWRCGMPDGAGQSTYVTLPRLALTPVEAAAPLPAPSQFIAPPEARLNVYVGEYRDGQREGTGTFYYADGSCYQGRWVAGAKRGPGSFTSAVGEVREEADGVAASELDALATVPVVSPHGLSSLLESEEDLRPTLHNLLQRYNTTLKSLFQHCCQLREAVALPTTPLDWWQQRLPGRATLTQCLALLHATHILGAAFTIGDALRTAITVVQIETTRLENSVPSAPVRSPHELSSAVEDINEAGGALNYRQFCEWLIRVAAQVERGPGAITVSAQLSALLDGPLRAASASAPSTLPVAPAVASAFLPHSLTHAADVQAHLPLLRTCYGALKSVCDGVSSSSSSNGNDKGVTNTPGVSLRCALTALHSTLVHHDVAPACVVASLAWLRDAAADCSQGEASAAAGAASTTLAQELRAAAMAKNKQVQQPDENAEAVQSFVEFVETVMTIADLVHDVDGTGVHDLLQQVRAGLFAK